MVEGWCLFLYLSVPSKKKIAFRLKTSSNWILIVEEHFSLNASWTSEHIRTINKFREFISRRKHLQQRECLVLVRKSDRMRYKVYGKLAFVCSVDCITILIGFIVSLFATYNNNFYNKTFIFWTIRCHSEDNNWFISNVIWAFWTLEVEQKYHFDSEWMKQFDRIFSFLAFVRKLMNCLMVLSFHSTIFLSPFNEISNQASVWRSINEFRIRLSKNIIQQFLPTL